MSLPLGSETQLSQDGARLVYVTSQLYGENPLLGALGVYEGPSEYENVAASQSNQVIGAVGGVGDYLKRLVCIVSTAATAQVQLKDGSGTAFTVLPNSPGGGVGTYILELGLTSVNGAWQVTTAAGVAVVAIGAFAG
jgi:hypothetical protein